MGKEKGGCGFSRGRVARKGMEGIYTAYVIEFLG